MNEKLYTCVKYVNIVTQMFVKTNYIENLDEKRTNLHERLFDLFNMDHIKLARITANLDIWLGLPSIERRLTDEECKKFGKRFYTLLSSEFIKSSNSKDIENEHQRLKDLWFDDLDFDGWKEE